MNRRIWMRLAVMALLGAGLAHGALVANSLLSRWLDLYDDYDSFVLEFVIGACGVASWVLSPLAAVAAAVYILLLERDLRRGSLGQTPGFPIEN